jgi:hypothetical protein
MTRENTPAPFANRTTDGEVAPENACMNPATRPPVTFLMIGGP